MKLQGEGGQVTVYLSVILLVVITLSGVLVDGARVRAGEVQVKRAVNSAMLSAMADYKTRLKEDYGIFAFGKNSEENLQESVKDYLRKNLSIDESGQANAGNSMNIKLYDYRIEDISVEPLFNLSENEVTRSQILEYMKYRAPKELVEGIIDRLTAVKESGKMSEAYKRKTNADRLAARIGKLQEDLKKNIDGSADETVQEDKKQKHYVNKFNRKGIRNELVLKYSGLAETYKSQLDRLKSLDREIRSEDDENERAELKRKRRRLLSEIQKTRNELKNTGEELNTEQTKGFIQPNEKSKADILEIVRLGREAKAACDDLDRYIDNSFEDGKTHDISKGFKSTVKEDIKRLQELIPDEKAAAEMIRKLECNISWLKEAVARFETIDGKVASQVFGGLTGSMIIKTLNRDIGNYDNRIVYKYNTSGGSNRDKKDDPRMESRKQSEEVLEDDSKSEDRNLEKEGISVEELPSRNSSESRDFSAEDPVPREETGEGPGAYSPGITEGEVSKYSGDLENLGDEIEFEEEAEAGFSEKAFGFISSMSGILSKKLLDLRDEIYINEYIVGTFKNAVPVLMEGGVEKPVLDLRGAEIRKRDTFFDYEVEYILHGNVSQNINKTMSEGQVLLVRFALNTLHVYLDPDKRILAAEIATAAAGWWTAGAGIPVITNLVMCGWGMGEAVIDLKHLMKGESVPFYKQKGDWELKIGPAGGTGPKSDPRFAFNYHDYMRLFLLLKSSDEKMKRIQDVIQINMQKNDGEFRMGNCNTYLRVEAVVSINYLFITQPFMPDRIKTRDGRHVFKVVLYQGY